VEYEYVKRSKDDTTSFKEARTIYSSKIILGIFFAPERAEPNHHRFFFSFFFYIFF
jgi:hypothetical protein